ncbi:2-succinyl-6-hydroxy-2,4-cyclohexadiene-1-carboxylate synthase [Weizmannia acidilactici]|uniref:2-succinyl-6-hydroxy-2, 4-cyclohexadiene-1-carboxylate synthase n=1 Tax=Weizmannia acidilactici TaxID=2607726 RepID=UPI00124D84D5|nr:2-succinyl-6-hydroxy-2,4-cyclohexadiene-1-carboxylate synthase [Weizmannia acidilactici]GER72330.1 putative 2-succinyl-6-hydroxy-2,4-cyclohexadiene-1-carboxylate synthase [Weizmannia acidilactici]
MKINGLEYHVETAGKGEPLLLLHGFTGNGDIWKEIATLLQDEFRCIFVDIIGHGKTAKPDDAGRYAIQKAAADLRAVLEQFGIDQASVLGYSMGGRLALTFAVLYPQMVKKLVLESASPGLKTEAERAARRKQDEQLADRILSEGIEAFVDYWTNIPLFESQKKLAADVREKIRTQRLENDPVGLANSLRGMGTGAQPSWWDCLQKLDFPVLLTAGEGDPKFCRIAEEMKARMPHAKKIIFSHAGHAIHAEDPRKFGTMVKGFLKNC